MKWGIYQTAYKEYQIMKAGDYEPNEGHWYSFLDLKFESLKKAIAYGIKKYGKEMFTIAWKASYLRE